ncbi:hypothetical protein SK128_028362 [Halocaridina rubra]|uniref:DNA-dependent protein kinase catalytic subunit CC5 domain-containing protein n=1 Tax=Halocaridina rubra TaxID=373956 RepID=A0AAN8WH80_HALRR
MSVWRLSHTCNYHFVFGMFLGTRSQALPHRLLHILQKIYSPESEDSFLLLATYILLEATSRSADYQRSIFDQPLTECKFWDMKVSTAWQARHASMIPMFAETQRTGSYSATQSSDIHAIPVEVGQILATQPRAFAETQATGGSYNWVTESTFDTTVADMEYQATHAPIHGAASGLLFSIGSSEKQDMLRFKTSGLGKKKMEAPTDDTPPDEASSTQSKLIRRRFVRNQDREKQSIHFAKIEERRRKQRDAVERMRRSRREAQVTMSRGYRDGEIPDIQIKHKELIAPLQTLAQCDNKTASKLFELLTQGVMDCKNLLMSPREAEDWHQRICCALNNIIASTFTCHTQLLKTILHLMINNDVTVNPEELSAVVKIRLGCEAWAFVSAYGPGSEKSEEESEEFWMILNECVEDLGMNVNVVLRGDLNFRVGNEPVDCVIGKYGVPGRNESGEKIVEMCIERDVDH